MAILGNQQGQLLQVPIFNYEKTQETAKSINVRCDFALDTFYAGNLSQERQQGIFQSIRSIYFNCENCANDVTFTCIDTGQVLTFEAGTSGYLPVLVSQGMRFRFEGVSPDVALFNLLNVDMPPAIWPTAGGVSPPFPFSDIEMTGPALLGRYTAGLGAAEEIQLGAGLSFVGDTLTMGAGGPYVLKAGDTMTGLLVIDLGSGALPATPGAAVFELTQADGVAPMQLYEAFASQGTINFRRANGTRAVPSAVQDTNALGAIQARGYGATAYASSTRSGLFFRATENWTDAAQGAQVTVTVTPNGTVAPFTSWRFGDDGSIFSDIATGGKQGNGTINAVDYFENGVNIDTLYVSTAGDFMSGPLIVQFAGTGTFIAANAIDDGANGPTIQLQLITTTPAVNDLLGQHSWIMRDSALGSPTGAALRAFAVDITPGAASARFDIVTRVAGSLSTRLSIANGVYSAGATGGDQGANTFNASSYYSNANIIADTNGLIRTRQYTVATLPAAGTAGRKAAVTDALAPAYGAIVAGGGAVNIPVYDNGANWITV